MKACRFAAAMMKERCVDWDRVVERTHGTKNSSFTYVVAVEGQWIRCPLGTAPEWLASAGDTILRQAIQQLSDGVVEFVLELETSPDDAFFEGERFLGD